MPIQGIAIGSPVQIKDPDFQFLRQLVYNQSSIHLGEEKREMVCNRLNRRLTTLGLDSVEEYCAFLKEGHEPDEIAHLIDALSTHFTQFFREIEHFKFLKDRVAPGIAKSRRGATSGSFRAWSAGCSTGEEAYSMAMVFAACFDAMPHGFWEVFASDVSPRVLETAREGIYDECRVTLPNPSWLPRFFQKGADDWDGCLRVKQQLRAQVDFQPMNLLDPHGSRSELYHVIFCRNVMIYFDDITVESLVESLADRLHEGGYLFIGHAECLVRKPSTLRQVQPSVFQKSSRSDS